MVRWNALVYFDLQGYNNIPLACLIPESFYESALQHSVCLFVRGSTGLVSVLKEALGDYVLQSREGEIFQAPVKEGNAETMEEDRAIAK